MYLTEEGCLLRRGDSGENHSLLVFFLKDSGLRFVLARRRSKPDAGGCLPDLFETGEVYLQQKDSSKPAFLREFTLQNRFPGIARQYQALSAASALAQFYERNLIHMENFGNAWELLQRALQSFSVNRQPQVTLLKALFSFARMEGYAVRAQWLQLQPASIRNQLVAILQNPVGQVSPEEAALVESAIADLKSYFSRETDLLPPS